MPHYMEYRYQGIKVLFMHHYRILLQRPTTAVLAVAVGNWTFTEQPKSPTIKFRKKILGRAIICQVDKEKRAILCWKYFNS